MSRTLSTWLLSWLLAAVPVGAAQAEIAGGFSEDSFSAKGVTAFVFDSEGRLFAAEKQGRVVVYERGAGGRYGSAKVVLDLSGEVDARIESGLLGIALDPAFASTRQLYLFYTTDKDQRLARVQLAPALDRALSAPQVILSGLPRNADFHKAGDIRFEPGNPSALLIALGDDNERQWANDLDRYHGKILRVHKDTGEGLKDNPFWNGNGKSVRARIWAHGLRNPFRFVFHPAYPKPAVVFISENGDETDRIVRVTRGSDAGWDEKGDKGGFSAPKDPGAKVLVVRPSDAQGAPIVVGLTIASGGAFGDPKQPVLLVAELRGRVFRYRLLGEALDKAELIESDPKDGFIRKLPGIGAGLGFGPDGALYTSMCGINEADGDFSIYRFKPR